MRIKADITLFIISIIWGSAFVAQRVAGQLGSVYQFNGYRYLLAGLVVLPFAWKAIQYKTIPRTQWLWMFIAGFVLFIAAAFQQAGMLYTTAGNAGFITSLYVVLIPILLFVFWKETPHWLSILAILLAGIGAFLLSTGGKFHIQFGDLLELIGATFWAIHIILLGKFASKFEAISFSTGQLIVCGMLNLGVGVIIEQNINFDLPLLFAIGYTAIFSLGLCYTIQVWAQRHTPPADAALLLSLESVFAVLAGWLMLNETLILIQIFWLCSYFYCSHSVSSKRMDKS
ncbi:MAG: putative DMT superfamily transporter inner membrane protein [Chloroflexi bacterium OLB14]|nr:MAG: putative DMT superfamily transporter inner membrane protein [Chloroflexi bacterium OLB14]